MRVLAAVCLGVVLAGCGMFSLTGAESPAGGDIAVIEDDPNDDPFFYGTPGDPGGWSHAKQVANQCRCMAIDAEGKLGAAVAYVAGGKADAAEVEGRDACVDNSLLVNMPTVPMAALGGKSISQHIDASKGASVTFDEWGNIVIADDVMLQVAATPIADALRSATAAQQTCSAMTLKVATSLWTNVLMPANNHGLSDMPGYLAKERARMIRAIRASHHADVVAAATTTLTASFRQSVESGQSKALSETAGAIAEALPVGEIEATSAELDELMARAKTSAETIKRDAETWAQNYRAQRAGEADPSAGKPLMREAEASDATAVASAFMGLFTGNVGAIVGGAAVLFPKDSPIRHGLKATSSLLDGDIAGTLSAASKMVPPDNKMASALTLASKVADVAQ